MNLTSRPHLLIFFIGILFFPQVSGQSEPDAELLLRETVIDFDGNSVHSTENYVLQINNRRGEKHVRVRVPFSSLLKVNKLRAEIKDRNGNLVKKLKKSDVVEKSSISDISFYEDDYIMEFILKHNTYPYRLEYSYETVTSEFLYLDSWFPVFDGDVPVHEARLQLNIPESINFRHRDRGIDTFYVINQKGINSYHWKTSFKGIDTDEIYTPSVFELCPSVQIIPINFKFDLPGSAESWTSFGNWQNSLLEGLDDLPDFEKGKITRILEQKGSREELVRNLYHYLQDNTHYINISIETGGFKPYPASYVAFNKFGDCKALSNYFRTLLAYAGIESY